MRTLKFLFVAVLFSNFSFSQIVGGRDNGEMAPKTVSASKLSAGAVVSDVNILNGAYTSTIPLGTVTTPGGLSFGVSLDYTSNASTGTTAPVCSGIPYGEGWNLSVPIITVETEAFHKYTQTQEDRQYTPCSGGGTEILRYDNLSIPADPYNGKNQGDLYWFAPELSIPGIVSGRLIFKYYDSKLSSYIFGLNAFESPIEVRLKNYASAGDLKSEWTIILADGTTYLFSEFMYSYNAPDNTRSLSYNKCTPTPGDNNAGYSVGAETYDVSGGYNVGNNVANVVVPKVAMSAWYCTKITNPTIEKQQINLVYQKFGKFNFYKEVLNDAAPGNQIFETYRDILLTEINSTVTTGSTITVYEKLSLDHQTLMSLFSGNPQLIDYTTVSGALRFDNMYTSVPVYSQGAVAGGSTTNMTNWSRYKHGKAIYGPSGDATNLANNSAINIDPSNPYITYAGSAPYYKRAIVPSSSAINFEHSFLESERISASYAMIPGDIYELQTSLLNTRGTIDVAIVTGDLGTLPSTTTIADRFTSLNSTDASGYWGPNYEKTRGIELFSTFNMAYKWTKKLNAGTGGQNTNGMTTSNFFVMPNVPAMYQGFHIQVGAGNSDVDNSLLPNATSNYISPNTTSPFEGKHGYVFMHGTNQQLYKSSQGIAHNFGNGYPWAMMMPNYLAYDIYPVNASQSIFSNWWSTTSLAAQAVSPKKYNRPTGLGNQSDDNMSNPATLKSVQLIRYTKNPYMLQGVKMYRNNNGTMELISLKRINYTSTTVDLVENYNLFDYLTNSPGAPHLDGNRKRVIALLSSVVELPITTVAEANMYLTDYGLTSVEASKVLTTYFTYAPLDLNSVTDIYSSIKGVPLYILSTIVDPLGGTTTISYNSVQTADLFSTLPSIPTSSFPSASEVCYGTNQAFIVNPIVASVSKTSESGVQTYSYAFSNPMLLKSAYELNTDRFRMNFVRSNRRGFMNVIITKPTINGVTAYTEVVHYGLASGTSYTGQDLNYLCYGKVKSTKDYMNGILNSEVTNTYDYTLAFQNGAIRPSYTKSVATYDENMTNSYLYEDYYIDQASFTSLSETQASLTTQEEALDVAISNSYYGELPKLMEGHFYNDLVTANSGQAFLFNSYFIKLVSESKKVYDDGVYKMPNLPAACVDRNGNVIPCIDPYVIEPSSCNNTTSTARRYIETKTDYTYFEADYTGKAIGLAYYNLFSIDPANPVSNTFGGVTKSNAIILLKHEPSWQVASIKNSSPQMGYANNKDEYFYFYDLVNRYDRHWYLMDVNANPNYTLTVFANSNTLYTEPIAVNNIVANTARTNTYSLPNLEGMQSSRVNNTRSLAYQKTSWAQNANDVTPVSKSEYYHFDNSWTYAGTYNINPAVPNVQTFKPALLRSTYVQIDNAVNASTFTRMDRTNNYIAEFKAVLTGSTDAYGKNYLYSISLPYANLKLKNINTRTTILQPSIVENQMGVQTLYTYLSTTGNLGLLASIKIGNTLPDAQTTSFLYTNKGLVQKITEPTTRIVEYVYDTYLRLIKTTENGTRILSENVYSTWTHNTANTFTDRTDLNYVKSTLYNSSAALDFEINKAFIDPLGRNHSILKAYTDDYGTLIRLQSPTLMYDSWNRVQKTYKPYIGPVTADLNLGSNTTTAFEEQQYENQTASRVVISANFGEAITTSAHTVRTEYKIINAVVLNCELGLTNAEAKMIITSRGNGTGFYYYKTRTIDQDGKENIQYSNALGQTVATVTYTTGTTKALTLFGYDSYGHVNKVINPNKQVTTYLYNILGQLTMETSVDGGTKKYMYNKLGLVSVSQNQEERTRLNSSSVLAPVYRVYKYDTYGKVLSVGMMNQTCFASNLNDPLLYQTTNNSTTVYNFTNSSTYDWTCSYYKVNNLLTMVQINITPAFFVINSYEKSYAYGGTPNTASIGKLITENSYNNAGVKILKNNYTYDVVGTINSQTTVFSPINADGAVSLTTTKIDYPSYNYRGSLLEEKIDMDNDLVTDLHLFYDYDALNRLTTIYGALGLVATSADATKLVSYEYDIYGHISKKQHFVDDNSNLSKLAMEIVNSYDVRDRLTQIEAKQGTTSVMKNNLFYDAQNPVDGVQTVLADQNWNGNINGSLTAYNFSTSSTLISTFNQNTLYGYKYDLTNRLVQADARVGDFVTSMGATEGSKIGDEVYAYDKIGNITSLQRYLKGLSTTLAQVEQWNYVYAAGTNKLTGVTGVGGTTNRAYTYDANGNLLTDSYKTITATNYGRASYSYRVTKGTDNIDYLYDTKDQRMYKKVDALDNNFDTEEYYIQDIFGRTVAIRKTQLGTNIWNYYISGMTRELSIQPAILQSPGSNSANVIKRVGFGKSIGYVYDHLGNTRLSYTPTAWNAVTSVCDYTISYVADYSPYGKIIREYKNGEPTKYVTTQHERDGETGLDYRGARYYDCDVARFLSMDPLANNFVSWSAYNYVLGNPILFIDPTGRSAEGTDDPHEKKTAWTEDHKYLNQIFGGNSAFNELIKVDDKNQSSANNNQSSANNDNNELTYATDFIGPLPEGANRVSENSQNTSTSKKFPGVIFVTVSMMAEGSGMTVPPFIYLGPTTGMSQESITQLKMHEYGHFLQFMLLGGSMFNYVNVIGIPSLCSASMASDNHHKFWTEIYANKLAYSFFGKPSNWDKYNFPLK